MVVNSRRSKSSVTLVPVFFAAVFILNQYKSKVTTTTNLLRNIEQTKRQTSYWNEVTQKCIWTPPDYTSTHDASMTRTLIAGYPGGDKRLVYSQMETITALSAKDEYDIKYGNDTNDNEPFIKTNYPHHEGEWTWGDSADQVVLVIRSIRSAMIHYHNILWELESAEDYVSAQAHRENLYEYSPPDNEDEFIEWRDDKAADEIHWWGWVIDFWMENGVLRDVRTNNLTTLEHFEILTEANRNSLDEYSWETFVGTPLNVAQWDPHCLHHVSPHGCKPVAIISAEDLISPEYGVAEFSKIGNTLFDKAGIHDHVISKDAWPCLWEETIIHRKGMKLFMDSPLEDFNFSVEFLDLMLAEVNRLTEKYVLTTFTSDLAPSLLTYLERYRVELETEKAEVLSGTRLLRYNDFLGPETRKKREKEIEENKLYWP